MRPRGPRPVLRATVLALAFFAAGLVGYGAVTVAWAVGTGERGRPPLLLLLVASVAFTAALPGLRRRAERLAVRVVLGQRADSYGLAMDFMRRMSSTMSVDDVLPRLAEAAARSVHSQRGEVRLLLADGRRQRQVWPPEAADGDGIVMVPVRHGGADVGELGVDIAPTAISSADRRLLADLAGPAGLALTSVRLTVELRRRLADVENLTAALQGSQERLVEARRSEQHRIRAQAERRLMPHLDQLSGHLAAAGRGEEVELHVNAAGSEAAAALEALRQLSRSVFSPVLADSGIKVALRAWADQAGVALEIRDRGDLSALHHCVAVEAALHFASIAVLELVPGRTVHIDVDEQGARVTLPWDGGGPTAEAEAVRQLLADRTDALGGVLGIAVGSATISAWLPFDAGAIGAPAPIP